MSTYNEQDALALINAVQRLNPDGTLPLKGSDAARVAGLTLTLVELDDFIRQVKADGRLQAWQHNNDIDWFDLKPV